MHISRSNSNKDKHLSTHSSPKQADPSLAILQYLSTQNLGDVHPLKHKHHVSIFEEVLPFKINTKLPFSLQKRKLPQLKGRVTF